MADKVTNTLSIDASAFRTLFASIDDTMQRTISDALKHEAAEIMRDAYERQPIAACSVGTAALKMRRRSDGVWVYDIPRRKNTYVTEEEADAYARS